jgi:hypothetical protein
MRLSLLETRGLDLGFGNCQEGLFWASRPLVPLAIQRS